MAIFMLRVNVVSARLAIILTLFSTQAVRAISYICSILEQRVSQIMFILAFFVLNSSPAFSEVIVVNDRDHLKYIDDFKTADEAYQRCLKFKADLGYGSSQCGSSAILFDAGWFIVNKNPPYKFSLGVFYFGKCTLPSIFNVSTANCGNDEQKGTPPLNSCVGNPINIAVGNKFQSETDYQSKVSDTLKFSRAYNSLDGLWRHNYSVFIRFAVGKLSVVHADGRESFFTVNGDIATAYATELGSLVKVGDGWLYTEPSNESFAFDASGRLVTWTDTVGAVQQITYVNGLITVTSNTGQTLTFREDAQHQPLSLTTADAQITYSYDTNQHLVKLMRTHGAQTEQRTFQYEDSRNAGLLTGITDERGIRFATWAYDAQGRAVSSQHSGGAGLTRVSYNADGSSTVTNELGKQATYRYQQIGGVKRIVAIKGEPSPNCLASNSSYTYNDRGQVLIKTDALGLITTYSYNDRGLETSRTEASGTPLARTTTTEWDPVRFLRTQVVEPTRTTLYSYDGQGRALSQQVISH